MGKDTRHLLRAGILLAVAIIGFLAVRQAFIPQSFGEYGHYRGENVAEWASLPEVYSHTSRCNDCHQPIYGGWQRSKHATVSCENCHGPGTTHIDTGERLVIPDSDGACLVCHQGLISRPSDFPQVDGAEHHGGRRCISCHNPHDPVTSGGPGIPHLVQGLSDCLMCHGQQGFVPFPESHRGRTNEVCLNCHQGSAQ